MRRAVIYTRVSSDPNDNGRSVDEQEAECRQVCKREGWRVVRVFSDNDRGASRHARKDRPEYRELSRFLSGGGADVLVMWEGSRAQRDLRDYLRLRDLCADRGILYSYSGRIYDLSRTDDRFNTGLDALLAEREADITRDRVLRAVRANAGAGRPHGKLLFGYRREYDDRGQFVAQVPDDGQAAIVREAAQRVYDGESCRSVALDFNRREILAPRGGQWDLTQIRRLVTNPAYIGQRVHQGKVIGPAGWPGIIEEKTYAECVRRMTDPRRRSVQDSTVRHLLSGTLHCGVCGGPMRVQKNRGFHAYLCRDGFCVSVKTTSVEEFVVRAIVARLSAPDALARLADPEGDSAADRAAAEAAEKRELLDGFYASAADGKISPAGLAKIEARLLPQIEDADRRARVTDVPPLLRKLAESKDIDTAWESLAIGQRREVVASMVNLRVAPTIRGSRTFDFHRLGESRWQGDTLTWAERWERS